MLRYCPAVEQRQLDVADGEESPLAFVGESGKGPALDHPVTLVVSKHNPGALRFAEEAAVSLKDMRIQPLEASIAELIQAWASLPDASFLLYLNKDTFCGDEGRLLASQVRAILSHNEKLTKETSDLRVNIFLAHECDLGLDGCEFSLFFSTTPNDLIESGIYSQIAIALHAHPFRRVSLSIAAQKLANCGAKKSGGWAARGVEKMTRTVRAIASRSWKVLSFKTEGNPQEDVLSI